MYHVITKPFIDCILAYQYDSRMVCLGKMDPVHEDKEKKSFNIKLINSSKLTLDILSFGCGGTTQYRLTDVLSNPITEESCKKGSHSSAIIINSPHAIEAVLLEFPNDLCELFSIDPITRLLRFTDNSKNADDLLAKGIDPEAKNWMTYSILTIPEWGKQRPNDFIRLLKNSMPIIVNCYSHLHQIDVEPKL